MAYSGFELASGDALAEIERLCRHAARGTGGTFSGSTVPTLASVEQYLTTSYYWIGSQLVKAGLSTTQTDTEVLGVLQQLQVYDVAMKVELALPVAAADGGPSARWETFRELRDELKMLIGDGSLVALGATELDEAARKWRVPFVGGISIARKAVMRDDTDAVQHRVRRGQFRSQPAFIPAGQDGVTLEETT